MTVADDKRFDVPGRFADKVAVVTGSTSGIGKRVAQRLAREGAKVVVSGRRAELGAEVVESITASGGAATYVRCDLADPDSCRGLIDATIAAYGRVDVLANVAAIFPRGTLDNTTVELWDRIFATNVRGVFLLVQRAVPHMRRQGGGAIVNVGSVNAYIGGTGLMAYAASKGALMTLSKNLARGLAKDRIRVNLVNPGWVLTEGERVVQQEQEGRAEDWPETVGKNKPWGRILLPEEVAGAICYLASDESIPTTGSVLTFEQEVVH